MFGLKSVEDIKTQAKPPYFRSGAFVKLLKFGNEHIDFPQEVKLISCDCQTFFYKTFQYLGA